VIDVHYKNDYYHWRSLIVCKPPPAGNDVKQIGAGRQLENNSDGDSGGDDDNGDEEDVYVYLSFLCTHSTGCRRRCSLLIWYDRLWVHTRTRTLVCIRV